MTKISTTDILSFIEANKSCEIILGRHFEPVKKQIIKRFADIESRISSTEDTATLKKLHEGKEFLKSVSQFIDLQSQHIQFLSRSIESIDSSYWLYVFEGQKLTNDLALLQETIASYQRRETVIMNAWRNERSKGKIKLGCVA